MIYTTESLKGLQHQTLLEQCLIEAYRVMDDHEKGPGNLHVADLILLPENEHLKDICNEILRRMKLAEPSEPVKTEKTTFYSLAKDVEFLDHEGNRNLAVSTREGELAALPLEGPSRHVVWWPPLDYVVQKIIM